MKMRRRYFRAAKNCGRRYTRCWGCAAPAKWHECVEPTRAALSRPMSQFWQSVGGYYSSGRLICSRSCLTTLFPAVPYIYGKNRIRRTFFSADVSTYPWEGNGKTPSGSLWPRQKDGCNVSVFVRRRDIYDLTYKTRRIMQGLNKHDIMIIIRHLIVCRVWSCHDTTEVLSVIMIYAVIWGQAQHFPLPTITIFPRSRHFHLSKNQKQYLWNGFSQLLAIPEMDLQECFHQW